MEVAAAAPARRGGGWEEELARYHVIDCDSLNLG
jgi:hypothetical protein